MNVQIWSLGDMTNYSPYKALPSLPEIHESDLVVLAVDAPQWLLFRLIDAIKESKAGAAAIPAPGGAVVVWSRIEGVKPWDLAAVEPSAPMLANRQEPVLTLENVAASELTEREKDNSEISVEVRRERKTETKPDVAIHAWTPKEENFQVHLDDIDAPVNYVVGTMDQENADARCKKFSDAAREVKSVRINNALDIAKIAEELEAKLRAERIPAESLVAINVSGASKYLWKALENVACALFENFYFVSYDQPNGRKQVSEDGLEWRWEPIRASVPIIAPAPKEKAPSPPEKEEPVDVWRIFDFSNVDPDTKKRVSGARQELTRSLWNFRDLMTNPYVTSSNGKISFQSAVLDNKLVKIKAETSDKNLMLYLVRTGAVASLYQGVGYGSKRKNHTIPLKGWNKEEINDYFSGGWFEEFVYFLLGDMKSNCANADLKAHVNVAFSGHELDVVLHDGKKYYLFECKAGRNNTPDFVQKLDELSQAISKKSGGKEVLGVMVYLQNLAENSAVVKKVKSSQHVACIHGARLPEIIKKGRIMTLKPGEVLH